MRRRGVLAAVLAAAAFLMLACTARTKMVTSWSAPGWNKASVKSVLVLGIAKDQGIRRTYEDDFSAKLGSLGYYAIPGYKWVPDAAQFDQEALVKRIKAEGITNVLVTRLVGTKTVTTEVPPTVVSGVGYAPYGPAYYGGWGSYYTVGYGAVVSPGYTTVNDVVTLETNFYDATKDKDALVWSGQSQTTMSQEEAVGSKIDGVIGAVVYEMRAKGVI